MGISQHQAGDTNKEAAVPRDPIYTQDVHKGAEPVSLLEVRARLPLGEMATGQRTQGVWITEVCSICEDSLSCTLVICVVFFMCVLPSPKILRPAEDCLMPDLHLVRNSHSCEDGLSFLKNVLV